MNWIIAVFAHDESVEPNHVCLVHAKSSPEALDAVAKEFPKDRRVRLVGKAASKLESLVSEASPVFRLNAE